jgi:hypothetical protein
LGSIGDAVRANENVLGLPAQPIDQPWLNPLPNKNSLSAWNTAPAPGVDWLALAGKAIEPLTSYPETYSRMNRESREQMGRGIDQIKAAYEPGVHDPIGFVTGLGNVALGTLGYAASPISAGLRTIVGKPFEETIGIPKEYSEFAASLGIPGLGLRSAFSGRPASVSLRTSREIGPATAENSLPKLEAAAQSSTGHASQAALPAAPFLRTGEGRLFDYSHLHEPPDVPQFNLPRYMPPRGVPDRIQALANPANIKRINDAARRGTELGGRGFYNTEPLREWFIAELGATRGQAEYEKYLNLVGATSPISKVGENIRNASYHYTQSAQGQPAPIPRWSGAKWTLAEPLPPPYGHVAQGLHAKKVNEALQQGGLEPLANPKISSYVQNLRGNQSPLTIDRHNTRLAGIVDTQGRPVDAPPQTGYGSIERLEQAEASKLGLTPAQYQASAWIGGANQTGVRSSLVPWLDSFEARVALSAEKWGITKDEMLKRFIRGELPLISLGGAAAAGTALPSTLGDTDE